MTRTDIETELSRILEDVADVPASRVTGDKVLVDDLDVDSLSLIEVLTVVEERFGIKIVDDEVASIHTVDDLVNRLHQRQAAG